MSRSRRRSFTLVELIVVLVLVGIMAAVAAPRFTRIVEAARNGMAQAGVNEAKASLTVGFAKAFLANNGEPGISAKQVTDAAGFTAGAETERLGLAFGDIVVDLACTGHAVTITPKTVGGIPVTLAPILWEVPADYR